MSYPYREGIPTRKECAMHAKERSSKEAMVAARNALDAIEAALDKNFVINDFFQLGMALREKCAGEMVHGKNSVEYKIKLAAVIVAIDDVKKYW